MPGGEAPTPAVERGRTWWPTRPMWRGAIQPAGARNGTGTLGRPAEAAAAPCRRREPDDAGGGGPDGRAPPLLSTRESEPHGGWGGAGRGHLTTCASAAAALSADLTMPGGWGLAVGPHHFFRLGSQTRTEAGGRPGGAT